jgi:hypothetical protein
MLCAYKSPTVCNSGLSNPMIRDIAFPHAVAHEFARRTAERVLKIVKIVTATRQRRDTPVANIRRRPALIEVVPRPAGTKTTAIFATFIKKEGRPFPDIVVRSTQ